MYDETLRPPTELPPKDDNETDYFNFESVQVLAYTCHWLVAYVRQYDGDEPKWVSGDSEGWDITGEVKGWIPLPPVPITGD